MHNIRVEIREDMRANLIAKIWVEIRLKLQQ